ncbi:5-oxoprolinase subunit PxpA [Gramella sp. AN32]|uniref:5-oxoprolinase subunit PxpA n=1 Tax=Christiangramia antarctica TaxID=2058158 RepID=A0ABW5X3U8_9FLAO|nr:5-oxoprolinase subunit PxpA [Gramella sp. AN32]MCM4155607.1 lactam utilization protein LamB [Gramella sp. AN32]
MQSIHINCDLGEGGKHDASLMPYISACNIACGGHAGDENSMRRTIQLAQKYKVEIGMHPSYPDKENFGRKSLNISKANLETSLLDQIKTFQKIAAEESSAINHLKFHGALYNDLANDQNLAEHIIEMLKNSVENMRVFAPVNSRFSTLLSKDFEVFSEAFLDRNYNENFTLVSRQNEHAVLTENEAIFKHLFSMYKRQKITIISGVEITAKPDTFCLHSDTKSAVEIIRFLHNKLQENSIEIFKNAG